VAFVQSQIDALKTAIATGVLTVKHGETLTTYRSMDEMLRLLAVMEAEVNGRSRRTVATYSRGV